MDRLLSLYRKLNSDGVRFYLWPLQEDKAVTMEVGGTYGIFMDFDNIQSSKEELLLSLMKADMHPQALHIKSVVLLIL